MKLRKILALISALLCCINAMAFTVVIDAGHGGHDAGAVGAYSKEKNINLKYALLVGELLKEKNPEIKVIYTRDKDVFVELKERAAIANRAGADLFVSIHTNSSKGKSANGMETFTLGASRSKENMEVAMLENSVILLEEDHEKSYEGFDPNSTDSYIMSEFMKDQYSNFSIQCADMVQSRIVEASGRTDRGVRQAGFLVLRATTMPSILIELGFISNRDEEKFLNQSSNQATIANAIYQGIVSYKHEIDKKNGSVASETTSRTDTIETAAEAPKAEQDKAETPQTENEVESAGPAENTTKITESAATTSENTTGTLLYIQFLASSNKYEQGDKVFKGLENVVIKQEGSLYKYMVGGTGNLDEIEKYKTEVKKLFPEAFMVAYTDGKKTDTKKAIAQIKNK